MEILKHLSRSKRQTVQYRGYDEYPHFNHANDWRGRACDSSLTAERQLLRKKKLHTERTNWLIKRELEKNHWFSFDDGEEPKE